MSMRPHISCVFGINDLKTDGEVITDSRYKSVSELPIWEILDTEIEREIAPYFIKYSPPKETIYLYEFFQWDAEFGVPSVMGLETASIDGEICYALGMLYPEFMELGYKVLPTEPENSLYRYSGKRLDILPEHFYKLGFAASVPQWTEAAIWIMAQVGVKVTPQELKWMLYWQWS